MFSPHLCHVFKGGPFDFWGGGGLRLMYLNNLFIFSQVENHFFYFTISEKQFFFFVHTKDETIFLAHIVVNLRATP